MHDEEDYLNYTDLNLVENKIEDLYDYYNMSYTPKTWVLDEFVYVDDIKNIEEGIDTIGAYFGYPTGYQTKRNWELTAINNISYRDINRWLHNIDFLKNSEFTPLIPSDTLYPRDGFIICDVNTYCGTDVISNPLIPSNNIGE